MGVATGCTLYILTVIGTEQIILIGVTTIIVKPCLNGNPSSKFRRLIIKIGKKNEYEIGCYDFTVFIYCRMQQNF